MVTLTFWPGNCEDENGINLQTMATFMNTLSIVCSTQGCQNPVIGQCTGYKGECRRFYCREHSTETLCADCASRKAADEHAQAIYQEYLTLSKKVFREPVAVPKFNFKGKNLIKVGGGSFALGAILFILFILIGILIANLSQQTIANLSQQTWESIGILYVFSLLGTLLIMGWPIITIPLVWLIQRSNWIFAERQKAISKRVNEIEKIKPGFIKFYTTWIKKKNEEQAEKNKKVLMGVLAAAGVIAAIAIGVAVSDMGGSTDDKIRNHEYRRH